MKLKSKLDGTSVTAILDTREQLPLDLSPLRTERGTLDTGDDANASCDHIRIERESLDDLLGCVRRDRERFDRDVMQLLAYPVRVLLIEATWAEIEQGNWRSKVSAEAVIGSLL